MQQFLCIAFTVEVDGELSRPDILLAADWSENWDEFEVNAQEVSEQAVRLNFSKSLGPIFELLKELKHEIAEVLARVCNLTMHRATW